MFGLHALQLEPAPVDDLVGEDGDQDGLEYWTAAVFVEVTLANMLDGPKAVHQHRQSRPT